MKMMYKANLRQITQAASSQPCEVANSDILNEISMKIQENILSEPIQKQPLSHLAISSFSFPETHQVCNDMPRISSKNRIWMEIGRSLSHTQAFFVHVYNYYTKLYCLEIFYQLDLFFFYNWLSFSGELSCIHI